MSDQPQSLAELCSICYTEKPKYRCPRCKTQTCSLPCYKRHQQRASCNGQRDPAAYLKRSEWATPSGIDRDYNYLKSVERHVVSTGEDVRERGITDDRGGEKGAAGNRKVSKAWVTGSALQNYLTANNVRVEKAPTGMSRQKSNGTRVTGRGKAMWTVEWIDGEGRKSLDNEGAEGRQIRELWGEARAKRLNADKRLDSELNTKKKRKIAKQAEQSSKAQKIEASKPEPIDVLQHPIATEQKLEDQDLITKDDSTTSTKPSVPEDPPNKEHGDEVLENTKPAPDEKQHSSEGQIKHTEPARTEHFYLLKPFTASKSIVLIPLDDSSTLTECLKDQTVLEYPTIYVLPDEPRSLPAGFQLEEQYAKLQKAEAAEVEGLMQKTNQSTGGALNAVREEEKPFDANSILDMLKRDVGM